MNNIIYVDFKNKRAISEEEILLVLSLMFANQPETEEPNERPDRSVHDFLKVL